MKLRMLIVAAAALCASCAAGKVWFNPTATNEQAAADFAACQYETDRNAPTENELIYGDGDFFGGIARRADIMTGCMRGRGYTLSARDARVDGGRGVLPGVAATQTVGVAPGH
jgi:hypothetical protein